MNLPAIITIIRKELRSYFLSPVALIFLGIFLLATLFIFFTLAKFFGRNLADVRPLFNWLPILLIFLVSAITMRQWSEEQKLGTLEILMTLPLRTNHLVIGKFFSGMILIALALSLTLPLPFTVAQLGDLDWGPVIGGYVGALLLGSTYMAIGLCVSSRTDNQIVALMVTLTVGGLLYLVGSASITSFFGHQTGEILRAIGTGSRFESIERGVLDTRDFAFYASLTVFFLTLNTYFLEQKRMDAQPKHAARRGAALLLTVCLMGLNVMAINVWIYPVTNARVDLTSDGEYTVSETTEKMIASLQEPLEITGYFSEKTHPLLAPLVPRIRDFLKEYEVRGEGRISVQFINPSTDEEIEKEIQDLYQISSVPFRISGRNEESVVNSFFHILVKVGDEFEAISFGDLVEIHADEMNVTVRLRNIEYDISRAIRKVTQGFQNLEAALASSQDAIVVTSYLSPNSLPAELKEAPQHMEQVATEFRAKTNGKVVYQTVDPSSDPDLQRRIAEKYGFGPLAVDMFSQNAFWCYILVQSGDKEVPLFPQGEVNLRTLRILMESGLQRMAPGFLRTIGLVTEQPKQHDQNIPGMPQEPMGQSDYKVLEQQLQSEYNIQQVFLVNGDVPGNIDALLIAKPGTLSEKELFAVDQYLMRGGAVLVLAGAYRIKPQFGMLQATPESDSILDLLEAYGVRLEQAWIMDPQNTPFPIPVRNRRGEVTMNRVELLPYPFFPDIRTDGLNKTHFAAKGIPSMTLTWASPIVLSNQKDDAGSPILGDDGLPIMDLPENQIGHYLAWSSSGSWLKRDTRLEPDFGAFPEKGFGPEQDAKLMRRPLAVALNGGFKSFFADRPSPLLAAPSNSDLGDSVDRTGRTLKASNEAARLAVVGSSEFVSDLVMQMSQQVGGGKYRGNMLLVRNLMDWALEDTDLLSIRSAGAFARTLKPMGLKEQYRYELANYVFVLFALLSVLALTVTRRRMVKSLVKSAAGGPES